MRPPRGWTALREGVILTALVLLAVAMVSLAPAPAVANDGWTLTGVCTPEESYPEFRRFVITNDTGVGREVRLENSTIGESVFVFAPPGESVHLVPAKATGANLTHLWVGGENVDVDQAVNLACGVLTGRAVCFPERNAFDITWTVTNNDAASHPLEVLDSRPVAFAPNPVPANGGTAVAKETQPAPAVGTREVTLTVEMGLGGGETTRMSERLLLGKCAEPDPAEDLLHLPQDGIGGPGSRW